VKQRISTHGSYPLSEEKLCLDEMDPYHSRNTYNRYYQ